MPRSLFTFSGASRAMKCALSMALPQTDHPTDAAADGTVVHAFLENVSRYGREEALRRAPDEYHALLEAIDVERLKISSGEIASEISYAYNPFTGESRELGRNLKRQYDAAGLKDDEIPGTLDVCGLEGEDAVGVDDYKYGRGLHVDPAYLNAQLKLGALAAARALGRSRARIAILRIYETGYVYRDSYTMDEFEMDEFEVLIRATAERGRLAREEYAAGTPPTATLGPHCRYCPSLPYCPAQGTLVRMVADDPAAFKANVLNQLTPETAAKAWQRVKLAKEAITVVDEALRSFAKQTPVDLGNGLVLGPRAETKTEINGSLARDIIAELFGPEVAAKAVESACTKSSIEDAVRLVAKDKGQPIKKLKEHALKVLQDRGALAVIPTEKIMEHKS